MYMAIVTSIGFLVSQFLCSGYRKSYFHRRTIDSLNETGILSLYFNHSRGSHFDPDIVDSFLNLREKIRRIGQIASAFSAILTAVSRKIRSCFSASPEDSPSNAPQASPSTMVTSLLCSFATFSHPHDECIARSGLVDSARSSGSMFEIGLRFLTDKGSGGRVRILGTPAGFVGEGSGTSSERAGRRQPASSGRGRS